MDSSKPPQKAAQLLSDLENIRQLLKDDRLEPPLLTDTLDPQSIPLLSDVVGPVEQPQPASLASKSDESEQRRLDDELHVAAQLLLQDVVDDFVPQIEAELKRRLELHLNLLLGRRKR
jgi:hypothetical protein